MLVIFKKNSFPHYTFYRHFFKSFWEGRYIDKAGKRTQRGDTGQIRAAEASVLSPLSGAWGYTITTPGFGAVLLCLLLDPGDQEGQTLPACCFHPPCDVFTLPPWHVYLLNLAF